MRAEQVAVMTMVRDEGEMLERWVDYYGGLFGTDNLIVLDHCTTDGSTDNLPCTRYRIPPEPWKGRWWRIRRDLANGLAQGLVGMYDAVLFTDADEFLVPDPDKYDDLADYIRTNRRWKIVAPLAVNVLHAAQLEPPIDPARPVLEQRSFVKFAANMCKPVAKRIPVEWDLGCHGAAAPYRIDPDLLMFHLKYYDVDHLRAVSRRRHAVHLDEGKGGWKSTWSLPEDEILKRLEGWVANAAEDLPALEPRKVRFRRVVREEKDGFWRSRGPQLVSMERRKLRQVPERFRSLL